MFTALALNYLRNHSGPLREILQNSLGKKTNRRLSNPSRTRQVQSSGVSVKGCSGHGKKWGLLLQKVEGGERRDSGSIFQTRAAGKGTRDGSTIWIFSSNIFPFHPVLSHFKDNPTRALVTVEWNVPSKSFPLLTILHPLLLEPQAIHECSPNHSLSLSQLKALDVGT